MNRITFADVVLVISLASTDALDVADTFLAHLEANEVTHIAAPKARNASDADLSLHDALVDADPMFLEWDSVQRTRTGRPFGSFAAGVDALPTCEVL